MYIGDNPTALQSQEWLVHATLTLMKEKPYNKITIRDICRQADLSRQTFYNFFSDRDEIIRFCLQKCYQGMKLKLEQKKPFKPNDIAEGYARFFEENRELLQLLVDQKLDYIIAQEISAALEEFIVMVSPDTDEGITKGYGNAFLAGAMTSLLIYWFKDNNRISADELSDFLIKILSSNYYRI